MNDDVAIANALHGLGILAAELGETAVAREYLLVSIIHYERPGYGAPIINTFGGLAWCSLAEGDTVATRDVARKAIAPRRGLQKNVTLKGAQAVCAGGKLGESEVLGLLAR